MLRRLGASVVLGAALALSGSTAVRAAPPVYDSGVVTLYPGWVLDLDDGDLLPLPELGDVAYGQIGDALYLVTADYLTHLGAPILKMGTERPTYARCRDAAVASRFYKARRLPIGTWLCARTDEGRVSRFKIKDKLPLEPYGKALVISYRTWTIP